MLLSTYKRGRIMFMILYPSSFLTIFAVCNSKNWSPSYKKGGMQNGLCRQKLAPRVFFWTGCSAGARTQGSLFCWRLEPKVRCYLVCMKNFIL